MSKERNNQRLGRSAWKLTLILSAGLALFAAAFSARAQPGPGCAGCHPDEMQAELGSVHASNGVGCAHCHGGDPRAADKEGAMSKAAGFRGEMDKKAVSDMCGGCHSDVRRMNPFGVPTDQFAQYLTSHHGTELYGKGDFEVAACADCHNAHGILKINDPRSPSYPLNVPSTCGRCHSDQKLMSRHGLESDQESLYRMSIHAEMLFSKRDLSAPTCVTCHGSHGAVPPGFSQVGQVCGKCHIKQKEYFDQGPHAGPARQGIFDGCVSCHRNHKILPASIGTFKVCADCHSEDEKAWTVAAQVRVLLDDAAKDYDRARARVEEAERQGFETDDDQALLSEARTYLLQLFIIQHALDVPKLWNISGQSETLLKQAEQDIARRQEYARWKKLALIPITVFLVLMSLGFWLKKRQIEGKP